MMGPRGHIEEEEELANENEDLPARRGSVSRYSVVALVFGLSSFGLSLIILPLAVPVAMIAVVCGHIGLSDVRRNPNLPCGARMAKASLWLGYAAMAFVVLSFVVVTCISVMRNDFGALYEASQEALTGEEAALDSMAE